MIVIKRNIDTVDHNALLNSNATVAFFTERNTNFETGVWPIILERYPSIKEPLSNIMKIDEKYSGDYVNCYKSLVYVLCNRESRDNKIVGADTIETLRMLHAFIERSGTSKPRVLIIYAKDSGIAYNKLRPILEAIFKGTSIVRIDVVI